MNIAVNGKVIENVLVYKYIGIRINNTCVPILEIRTRIKIKINITLRLRALWWYLFSAILYGVEAWIFNKKYLKHWGFQDKALSVIVDNLKKGKVADIDNMPNNLRCFGTGHKLIIHSFNSCNSLYMFAMQFSSSLFISVRCSSHCPPITTVCW